MANLPETAQWDAGVYQIEITDPVVGGADGVDNKAARNLANRTLYLKAAVESVAADLAALGIAGVSGLATELAGKLPVYAAVPGAQAESLIYVAPYGVMAWNATHGLYRAVDCGQLVIHTSASAKAGTLKASGALVSKATYAGLWSQAQDDGLVAAVGSWTAGTLQYEDYDANQFRIPDLRGEFLRMTDDGRGVDAGRVFGSWQTDALRSHTHGGVPLATADSDRGTSGSSFFSIDDMGTTSAAGGAETRPRNVALLACIHF